MTDSWIKKQEFLLNARAGNFEGQIVCPRCEGHGTESLDNNIEKTEPCLKCHGQKIVKRRVNIVVEDTPVGKG